MRKSLPTENFFHVVHIYHKYATETQQSDTQKQQMGNIKWQNSKKRSFGGIGNRYLPVDLLQYPKTDQWSKRMGKL
jgi:hypothetical protein